LLLSSPYPYHSLSNYPYHSLSKVSAAAFDGRQLQVRAKGASVCDLTSVREARDDLGS